MARFTMWERNLALALFAALPLFTANLAMAQTADCQDRPVCLGDPITEAELAPWKISVFPDGTGLPEGQGSAEEGRRIFERECAACHGKNGVGLKPQLDHGAFPSLVGSKPPLNDTKHWPAQTVGSYWPHATTIFDYVRRAMPFALPQSLSNDEVYALVAHILEINKIVPSGTVMDKRRLMEVKMPNANGFVCDPRPDVFNTRCMKNCKVPADPNFSIGSAKNYGKPVPATDCMLPR